MNTKIVNMMSFMTERSFLIKSSLRAVTLPKIMTKNNNNKNEMTYLREDNKAKTLIIQTLLENQKISQSVPNLFSKSRLVNLTEPITDKAFITPTNFT